MDLTFDVPPAEFQARKKRRIEALSSTLAAGANVAPKQAPVSGPGVHEIATYLPGRLEFEHELDNEAEDSVKDLEFGLVADYGGNDIPEDENDVDVKARKRWEETRKDRGTKRKRCDSEHAPAQSNDKPLPNGVNGHSLPNGYVKLKAKTEDDIRGTSETATLAEPETVEEPASPLLPIETPESIRFKLSLLNMYHKHVARRHEAKAFMFQRGLLEYKKVCMDPPCLP
jgi:transcriptional adapter 2-alpha